MNTPAHLIFGMTAFGKADRAALTGAALAGSLIPDLSLYLLVGVHLLILGTAPEVIFGQLYFSDAWQSIFRIDNSMILWGCALAIGVVWRKPVMIALSGAGMMHLVLDFGFHHDDGRAHFWPITDWIFMSPVSYWDPAHHGGIVGVIELVVALGCCVLLWRRYVGRWMRGLVAALAVAQVFPMVMWAVMFSG